MDDCGIGVICRVHINLLDCLSSLCDEEGFLYGGFDMATMVWRYG